MALESLNFDPPTPEEEQASMREILTHLAPRNADDVRMVAAALKTHGPKFEEVFYEWATPYGRYKAKGLWAKVKADPDAMTEVIDRQIAAQSNKRRFSPLPAEALEAMPPQQWRIKGVFPVEGLAVVYGASTAGKSFLALEMAYCIAQGLPFFEHIAKPAAVLYVGLEGEGGYRGRVVALQRHHGRAMPDGVRFLLQPFRLTVPQDVADLAAVCPPGCVVFIDTLNRAAPGMDENSSRDMGAVIEGAKELQRLTGGLVVLIAHTGKDSAKGLRGHSSLFAALDAAVLVNRDDTVRSWKVDKAKDGKDGETHYFRLNIVEVGIDEDGEAVTSCVVVPDEAPTSPGAKPLNAIQKLAMESFREACRIHGSVDGGGNFLGINREAWRPVFYRLHVEAPSDEARRKAFERVRKELVERGELIEENNVYRLGGLAGKLAEACIAKVIQQTGQPDGHRTERDASGAAVTRTDRTAAL